MLFSIVLYLWTIKFLVYISAVTYKSHDRLMDCIWRQPKTALTHKPEGKVAETEGPTRAVTFSKNIKFEWIQNNI